MVRAKIGLAAAAVVALVTALVVWIGGASMGKTIAERTAQRVESAKAAIQDLDRLRGIELTEKTVDLARGFSGVFGSADARAAARQAIEATSGKLEQEGHRADLIMVVSADGRGVARNLNPTALVGDDLKGKYPLVKQALSGIASKDIWDFDGQMYRVAAAPIHNDSGQNVGALAVGYVVAASDAERDRQRLGVEVAYFLNGKVRASSFRKSGGESAEEAELAQQLFEGPKYAAEAGAGKLTPLFSAHARGEEFIAAAGPLSGNASRSASGFVLLVSLTEARSSISAVETLLLVLGLIGMLGALLAGAITARRFIDPLDKIESGVAEVINGNRDYVFESPSPEFEGLANGLNVMLARLLGRPDPTDDAGPASEE